MEICNCFCIRKRHYYYLSVCLLASLFSVVCSDDSVRIINTISDKVNEGRVEVYYGGTWGTTCDDEWGLNDADVICRQLGYTGAMQALGGAYFGLGSGYIWLDNVNCVGTETRIQDCANNGWGVSDCVHREDAGVKCSSATVRLVEGSNRYEGNVQILHNEMWGYVCDNGWGYDEASVVCNQLDRIPAETVHYGSYYGSDTGTIWLDGISCNGKESSLDQCTHSSWGNTSCSQYNKAGVKCVQETVQDGAVRLVGTSTPRKGRVEIYHNGEWGTVCDDAWSYNDAKVVCRQLNYTNVKPQAYGSSYFGAGTGRIWLDNVVCYGFESRLETCPSSGWGKHDCSHSEDAGVYCDDKGDFDTGEIIGITFASLVAFVILLCCVRCILCDTATNKRQRRIRRQRAANQREPSRHTSTSGGEAHHTPTFTISDDVDFAPVGTAYPPPFTPTEPPPSYDFSMSMTVTAINNTAPNTANAATANPLPQYHINSGPAVAGNTSFPAAVSLTVSSSLSQSTPTAVENGIHLVSTPNGSEPAAGNTSSLTPVETAATTNPVQSSVYPPTESPPPYEPVSPAVNHPDNQLAEQPDNEPANKPANETVNQTPNSCNSPSHPETTDNQTVCNKESIEETTDTPSSIINLGFDNFGASLMDY